MEEIRTISVDQLCQLYRDAEAEEATWNIFELFAQELALKPNGQCHWYVGNATYSSLEEAIIAVREHAIEFFESCIKTYKPIVERFDKGDGKYDSWFTETRIQSFRESLPLYPIWIQLLKDGKFMMNCGGNCGTIWVDSYTPDLQQDCKCGRILEYK